MFVNIVGISLENANWLSVLPYSMVSQLEVATVLVQVAIRWCGSVDILVVLVINKLWQKMLLDSFILPNYKLLPTQFVNAMMLFWLLLSSWEMSQRRCSLKWDTFLCKYYRVLPRIAPICTNCRPPREHCG